MLYASHNRSGRPAILATLLQPPVYRLVLAGLLAFCLCVGTVTLMVRSQGVTALSNLIPPGTLYHVRASGEVVPLGQATAATPAPRAAVPAHANLLDHQYHITAEFGHYPDGSPHYGLDVDAWTGTTVHAPVGGTVTEVLRGCVVGDTACGKGWGNHVWFKSVETGDYILLAHFSQLNDWVQVGATFDAGAPFGLSGSTGFSSGPHVHVQVNPTQMANAGSTQPAWEFPWLHCTEPVLGALFGAACP